MIVFLKKKKKNQEQITMIKYLKFLLQIFLHENVFKIKLLPILKLEIFSSSELLFIFIVTIDK